MFVNDLEHKHTGSCRAQQSTAIHLKKEIK